MRRVVIACAALLWAALALWATVTDLLTPVGRWKTIDDKTGKPKAIVQLYMQDSLLVGRIETTLAPHAKKICDQCKDERKNQPIIGMVIVRGLKLASGEYTGGEILDPDNGSVYRCKMRLRDQGRQLQVRGYIGFSLLGRTQIWTREP